MKIDVPFKYSVTGLQPRKRNSQSFYGYDTVNVEIHEVADEDCPVVLELLDEDGGPAEIFRHYRGEFFIRNARLDDLDFGKEHIMLTGHWPKKSQMSPSFHENRHAFTPYTRDDADRDNKMACKALSAVGLMAYRLLGIYTPFSIKFNDDEPPSPIVSSFRDGLLLGDVFDPSDEFRLVEASTLATRRQAAVEYAQSNVIAVDGELWHRAPTPMIYAAEKSISWAFNGTMGQELKTYSFGSREYEREDTRLAKAYKMAMTEYDTIPDVFPEALDKNLVKFYIEYIDPSYFAKPEVKPLVIKDIKSAMARSGVINEPTPFVHKWLVLRDLVKGSKTPLEERDEEFLDSAADILIELDAMQGKNNYPGAVMWANRQVDFDMSSLRMNKNTPD